MGELDFDGAVLSTTNFRAHRARVVPTTRARYASSGQSGEHQHGHRTMQQYLGRYAAVKQLAPEAYGAGPAV